jgi:hypothetical protein
VKPFRKVHYASFIGHTEERSPYQLLTSGLNRKENIKLTLYDRHGNKGNLGPFEKRKTQEPHLKTGRMGEKQQN